MADRLMGALGLARRAGALAVGFDAVAAATKNRSAALVLLASDASPGTKKRALAACGGCPAVEIHRTMHEIAQITGKPAGVLAVTNKDLAGLCKRTADEEEAT